MGPTEARRRSRLGAWWVDPANLLVFLILPLFLLSAHFGGPLMPEFGTFDFLAPRLMTIGAACILTFALALKFGAALVNPRQAGLLAFDWLRFDQWLLLLLTLTVIAHLLLLGPLLAQPGLMLRVLAGDLGANFEAKEALLRIVGLTSLTNLAPLVSTMVAIRFCSLGRLTPGLYSLLLLILLAALILVHAMIGSERIALLANAIAFAIPLFSFWPRLRRLAPLAPLIGFVLVLSIFALGEYTRSWAFYRDQYSSFAEYAGLRFLSYVAVASNSGAGMITTMSPVGFPLITNRWVAVAPVVGVGNAYTDSYLFYFGNEEFNNPSGVFAPVVDFGLALGLLYLLAFGLLFGLIYGLYRTRNPIGLMIFPLLFPGFANLTQIWYWGEPRFVPQIAFMMLSVLLVVRRRILVASA